MLTKKDKSVATAEAIRMEATGCIRSLALPIAPGETIKAQWRKVSRKTGLSVRRVRTLWYGQASTIHAYELDLIRNLTMAERHIDHAQSLTKEIRSELAELRARIANLDHLLARIGGEQ